MQKEVIKWEERVFKTLLCSMENPKLLDSLPSFLYHVHSIPVQDESYICFCLVSDETGQIPKAILFVVSDNANNVLSGLRNKS